MTTRPDPTPTNSGQGGTPDGGPARSTIKRFVTFSVCLAVLAHPVDRWLGVLDHAAQTYSKLKDSGLIDLIAGG